MYVLVENFDQVNRMYRERKTNSSTDEICPETSSSRSAIEKKLLKCIQSYLDKEGFKMVDCWKNDAISLVEAFRSGERTPEDETQAVLSAIEKSSLNVFSYIDKEGALLRAENADVSLPLGGVPIAVKELHNVDGWPDTGASVVFKDRISQFDGTMIQRLKAAGANLIGLTTASEFGGLNCSTTKLNGITTNPWNRELTPGGSSGGSAAAVAGGIVTLGTGGDGGGSIRIPAGFCGLVGMKGTAGRIPRGTTHWYWPVDCSEWVFVSFCS